MPTPPLPPPFPLFWVKKKSERAESYLKVGSSLPCITPARLNCPAIHNLCRRNLFQVNYVNTVQI